MGIVGLVRNRSDGRVEVVAEGELEQLRSLIAWCQHGPPLARVSDVIETWQEAKGEFDAFDVTH